MLYTIIEIGGNEYKARLDAKACVELEKKIGSNPLNVFSKMANEASIPDLGTMIEILRASLVRYQPKMNADKAYEIYDKFVDDGHTMTDLIPILLDIFKVSGFYKEETDQEDEEEKN